MRFQSKLTVATCALNIMLCASAFAMGSAPRDGGTTPTPSPSPTASSIPTAIKLNPYIMALQKEFANATKPVAFNRDNQTVVGDGIEMGKRYDCRVFYALTRTDTITPSQSSTWYKFQRFGSLFIDNLGFFDGGRIKTYAPNTELENEVWGQADDRTYYEAIRVTKSGDLVIEAFTPKEVWLKSVLTLIGLGNKMPDLKQQAAGLALETLVAGANGFIVSYTYCPKNVAGLMEIESQFSNR